MFVGGLLPLCSMEVETRFDFHLEPAWPGLRGPRFEHPALHFKLGIACVSPPAGQSKTEGPRCPIARSEQHAASTSISGTPRPWTVFSCMAYCSGCTMQRCFVRQLSTMLLPFLCHRVLILLIIIVRPAANFTDHIPGNSCCFLFTSLADNYSSTRIQQECYWIVSRGVWTRLLCVGQIEV